VLEPLNGIFVKDQLRLLRQAGVRVDLVHADLNVAYLLKKNQWKKDNQLQIDNDGNIDLILSGPTLPKNNRFGFKKWIQYYIRLVETYISAYGLPHLIHAHTYLGAIVAHQLKEKMGLSFIVTLHFTGWIKGGLVDHHKRLALAALRESSQIICVSNDLKKALTDRSALESIVVPNFIDESLFVPPPKRSARPFVLLGVGDLIERKQWHMALSAFAELKSIIPACRLVLVGDGPESSRLKNLTKELNLENDVYFKGVLDQAHVIKEYQNANVLIHVSKLETFGIVLLEALSCGLPVVGFENPAVHEILKNRSGCRLVEMDNIGDLVKSLILLYRGYDEINFHSVRADVLEDYSAERVTKKYINLYNKYAVTY
jgi:Glycosyltransferase